jgi:hypothetical protein
MALEDLDSADLLYRAPALGQATSVVTAVRRGAVGEAVQQCTELGQATYQCVFGDPLEVLCVAGLSWLVGVFQPFEDELAKVTGNGDLLRRDCERWRQIAVELADAGIDARTLPDRDLAGWRGRVAHPALERLRGFAAGLEDAAGEIHDLRRVLIATTGMFEAARGLVLEILSALVEWAVVNWLTAQAAAAATLGASLTMAIAEMDTEIALATSRAARISAEVEVALLRVERALVELSGRMASHLPAAATELAERTTAELAGRVPGAAVAAAGQVAAAVVDSSTAPAPTGHR